MIEIWSYAEPSQYNGCLYGSEERRNHQLKRDQAISLLLCLTISFLLFSSELRRVYKPLARIVNASIIIKLLSTSFYFLYFPYNENEGNCTEIFLSRVYHGLIMLGRLIDYLLLLSYSLTD